MSVRWQKTIVKWSMPSHSRALLVVRYEDLKKDMLRVVLRMLDFLQQDYNSTAVATALKGGYDKFRRSRAEKDGFQHFTPQQKDKVNGMILQTLEILKEHKLGHLFKIREYLKVSPQHDVK